MLSGPKNGAGPQDKHDNHDQSHTHGPPSVRDNRFVTEERSGRLAPLP